jgi:hypothetical protein
VAFKNPGISSELRLVTPDGASTVIDTGVTGGFDFNN